MKKLLLSHYVCDTYDGVHLPVSVIQFKLSLHTSCCIENGFKRSCRIETSWVILYEYGVLNNA